jgi:hypothetical protein
MSRKETPDHDQEAAPMAANDDHAVNGPPRRPWTFARLPAPRHLFIIATGAIANLTFVSFGLHGAFGVSVAVACLIAAWLIALQTVLYEVCLRNGLLLNLTGLNFCALFVGFNVLLAAGGLTATFGTNALGQSAFRQSVEAPLQSINSVAETTSRFAGAMSAVAAHSKEQHRLEVANGGTCTASDDGDGPISRLRDDDAKAFDAASRTANALSAEASRMSTAINGEIANYTVAGHQAVIATISTALARARQVAGDQQMATIRAQLKARAGQITTGRPDSRNPQLRVLCPRDTVLADVIARALAIPAPGVSATFELPPVPSEATSVRGLFNAVLAKIRGGEVDLSPWLASLALAPFPDGLFVYGLMLHRRHRKARRTIKDEVADDIGLDGDDPEGDFERAVADPRVQLLYASHIAQHGWIFRTDWLAIPFSETARRHWALRMVTAGKAYDGHIRKGADLPRGGTGFVPEEKYHLFALKPGIFARLEAETIRAVLASPPSPNPDPSQPSGTSTRTQYEGQAAA